MSDNPWLIALVAVIVVVAAVMLLRRFQLKRSHPRRNSEPFRGRLYAVGEARVALRETEGRPRCSVICMHGFMEDHRYFTELYSDRDIELILLTSGDYNAPVADLEPEVPAWAKVPPYELGTIEYDADVLNQALENLVSTDRVRLHGHSRGGAVVLEAARQRPELHRADGREIEVVLEAPVLPEALPHPNLAANMNAVGRYLLPFTMPLMKRMAPEKYGRGMFGELSGRKRELIASYPHNPRHYDTVLRNALNIQAWMSGHGADLYDNVQRGWVLVGEDEQVLDRGSMVASAKRAKNLEVVETTGTTHFITLDSKEQVPAPFSASAGAEAGG